jgi:hypothetical protein
MTPLRLLVALRLSPQVKFEAATFLFKKLSEGGKKRTI